MIIDHGFWKLAESSELKPGRQRIIHARREDTGMDWYEFVKLRPFGDGSVIMTVGFIDDTKEPVVQAASRDPTAIFPAGMRVIEETDYAGDDPFKDYHGRAYVDGSIGGMHVSPPPPLTEIETAIFKRLAAIEEKLGIQP